MDPGGHYLLEVFVIQLLRVEIESEGKKLQYTDQGSRVAFDAIAPQGIGQIPGPLLIEIKSSVTPRSIENTASLLKRYPNSEQFSLLVISFREMTVYKEYFEDLANLTKGRQSEFISSVTQSLYGLRDGRRSIWISADYSLPSWEGHVITEHPEKDDGDEPQAQER